MLGNVNQCLAIFAISILSIAVNSTFAGSVGVNIMFSPVLLRFHCNKKFLVYIKNEIYAFRVFLTFFSRANFSTFNFLFTLLQAQYFLSICLSLRFDFDDDGCPLCPHLNRAAPLLLPRSCVDSEPSSGRMVG